MFKNSILITLLIFTVSCGYEPLFSKKNLIKNSNFSIDKISFIGDRDVNIKIKQLLVTFSTIKKDKNFTLEIDSKVVKTIIAKDIKGDPSQFNLDIKTIVQLDLEGDPLEKITFNENFKYNNKQDKFEIKRYEREIKQNLAEKISNDLIYKLANY
tara:strand:+ start:2153 stop:2617 length:465 start_codon:yes stop_codon:yes gene_type:complete